MNVLPKLYYLSNTLISQLPFTDGYILGNSTEALIKFAIEDFQSVYDRSTFLQLLHS